MLQAYKCPHYFTDDWLNDYFDLRHSKIASCQSQEGPRDVMTSDYRFIYLGRKVLPLLSAQNLVAIQPTPAIHMAHRICLCLISLFSDDIARRAVQRASKAFGIADEPTRPKFLTA